MAIALLYYAAERADIVVFETGLGGTLDCTNVISTPVLTVITSISLDHTQVLGETVAQIAAHKAGIIKPEIPCILSAQNPPEAGAVVKNAACEQHSSLTIPDETALKILDETLFGSTFSYKNRTYRLSMSGRHQIINALSVIEGARILTQAGIFTLSDEEIAAGIANARVPARVEILSRTPLVILDGGHNEGGFAALGEVLQQLPEHNLTALIGMIRGKDIARSVAKILPYVREFFCADGYYPAEVPKNELCEIITALGAMARTADFLPEELRNQLISARQNNTPLLICGSLYFCAQVRKLFFRTQA